MKLSEYSLEQIAAALDARSNYLEANLIWKHQDRRYKALMNEFERKILKHGG